MSQQTERKTAARVMTETKVAHEDVDDIIGIAARMKDADADRLTVEELEEVADELGIEPQYVARAVETLRQRRADLAAEAEARRAARRRLTLGAGGGVVALVIVVVGLGLVGRGELSEQFHAAEQKRAQVVNVMERQAQVEARLKDQPQTPDREAELVGSENRVRIEKRRYDEAAAQYNSYASSIPGTVAVTLFGMSEDMPLSSEIKKW